MPMVLQSTIPFPDSVEMGKNHLCISVLQSYGIKIVSLHKPCSAQVLGTDSLGGDIQSCKLCGHSENIANMLLCDRCEEAFHVSCCKPRVVLPIDEWFCPSCLKMSQNNSFIKSPSIGSGIGSCKFELGPIAVMLKYPEPYTSKVRLGEAFQAQVPEWCDQINVAPLSEVQTDDPDCSSHSDCADPRMRSSGTRIACRKRKQEFSS
ncbi:hypothetical protein GBA52_018005 [Prunus armeniaca]|nr:hypothetical protein GBA52_018005 [Prunus armeniaca]